jgi:hypothetical protein
MWQRDLRWYHNNSEIPRGQRGNGDQMRQKAVGEGIRKETEYVQEERRIHKGGERILMASPAAYVPSRFLCIYTPPLMQLPILRLRTTLGQGEVMTNPEMRGRGGIQRGGRYLKRRWQRTLQMMLYLECGSHGVRDDVWHMLGR